MLRFASRDLKYFKDISYVKYGRKTVKLGSYRRCVDKIEPIEWFIDEKNSMLVCTKIIDCLDGRVPSKCLNVICKGCFFDIENISNNENNIIKEIIQRKYNLIGKKAKVEKIKKLIDKNEILKLLMQKHNLKLSDIEIDEQDNLVIEGLKL